MQSRFNENERSFLNILKDAKIEDDYILRLINNYECPNNSLKGVQGYFLFNYFAERITEAFNRKNNDNFEKADFYLRHEETLKYISKIYGIEGKYLQLKYLRLEAIGSTSFILKSNPDYIGKCLAIKLLKYRYFDDESIKKETKAYKEKFESILSDGSIIPSIELSEETYIIMDFFGDSTLEEYIKNNIFLSDKSDEIDEKQQYMKSMAIIEQLLTIMNKLKTKYEISHLDLVPSNILVYEDSNNNITIKLIDFGVNYIFNTGVGFSLVKYLQQQVYLAPELANTKEKSNYLADVYSVGIIILEMLARKKLEKESVYQVLLSFSLKYSGLSRIIIDMIYPEPEKRLLMCEQSNKNQNKNYEFIKNSLKKEMNFILQVNKDSTLKYIKLTNINDIPDLITNCINESNNFKNFFSKDYSSVLKHCMLYNSAVHIFIFLVFSWMLIKNSNNWPSYVVALSFTFIATSYYRRIFFNIYTIHFSYLTEICIRVNSIIFGLPIIMIINYPELWAVFSAIGVFIVSVNNYLNYSEGKKSMDIIEKEYSKWPLKEPISAYLDSFGTWWKLVFYYALLLVILQILISCGKLKDVGFYSIIVAFFINIIMLDYFKTQILASEVNFTFTSLYDLRYWILNKKGQS